MHRVTDSDRAIAAALMGFAPVVAVALGGSRAVGHADAESDTDMYALHRGSLPPQDVRQAALAPLADRDRVWTQTAWGTEDHLRRSGTLVEVVYLNLDELDLEGAFTDGLVSEAYTTSFLFTLAHCLPIRDEQGELNRIQRRLATYPEATRARLVDFLPGVARHYVELIELAQRRRDWTAVSHRRGLVTDVYFNLLFAINRQYNPGEKRLLDHADACARLPRDHRERWTHASVMRADDRDLPVVLSSLVRDLVALI